MNISQHLFVPYGKVINNRYYSSNAVLASASGRCCTQLATGCSMNSFELFPIKCSTVVLRCFKSDVQGFSTTVGQGNVTYSILSTKCPIVSDKMSITFSASAYPLGSRIPVLSLGWYEVPDPSLSMQNFGNILIPDILDEEVLI